MNIEWKPIVVNNLQTFYSISEYGNVRNDNTGQLLKPCTNTSDRPYVCLYIDKNPKIMMIHKCVYEAFIGPIPENMTVDHIDENFLNNHYTNLRLLTRGENTKAYLDNHPLVFDKKYEDCVIEELCRKLSNGIYYRDAADDMDIQRRYVYDILRGKRRANISKKYIPFPRSAFRSRLIREINYPYIMKSIIDGMSTKEIVESMDAEYNAANTSLVSKIRKRMNIPDPRYFDQSLIEDIDLLILDGKSNSEIYDCLSIDFNKRISWLMARERAKLGIKNNNCTVGSPEEIQRVRLEIKNGKSNDEILKIIGKERNQYYVNLFGKLRKEYKKYKLSQ